METRERQARSILAALRRGRLSRREALAAVRAAGLTAIVFRLLSGVALADETGPGGIPLARPDKPVKLPLYNEAIKSGLEAERGGVFNIYNYAEYVDPNLLKAFSEKYDVTATVTTFDSIDEAITKLASNAVRDMDVT